MCVLVRYHTNEGIRSALLLSEGRKYLHILPMDYPLQVNKVSLDEGKYMQVLAYPLKRALRHYRHAAKEWHGGIRNLSAEAHAALQEKAS